MPANPSTTALTPIGTLCFTDSLFQPKPRAEGSDKLAYSVIIGFDDVALKTPEYQKLREAVMAAIKDKWGEAKAKDAAFVRTLRLPFRDAAEKSYAGFENFEIFISPWTSAGENRKGPGVVDIYGNDMFPTDVFSGQLGRATVRAFAYDNSGNKGVSLGLEHVQVVKKDATRIDGRRSAAQAFANADNSQLAAYGIDPTAKPGTADMPSDMPF